ncbi:HNH endonuclease [Variovorax sp. PAMC 28711]
MTGSWPVSTIDHRNGIKDDNRWDNLRTSLRPKICTTSAERK